MQDSECVEFLQWALPRLHRRWSGFRKVRRTTCKCIARRLQELNLSGAQAYREFLECNAGEWSALDALLPITISSFYRDKAVFDFLGTALLPHLAQDAQRHAARDLRALSIGCASGEEPYTLRLVWHFHVAPVHREISLHVVATDVLSEMLERAHKACYPSSSLKRLPEAWRAQAFEAVAGGYCLRAEYRQGIEFVQQDVRTALPDAYFNLILCRNLVFTYFDESMQRQILERLLSRLLSGGALVIGRRETLPSGTVGFIPWPGAEPRGIFQRR